MKYFRMSYEEVVFRRSYINILLLNRSIPSFYSSKGDDDKGEMATRINKHKFRHESELFGSLM